MKMIKKIAIKLLKGVIWFVILSNAWVLLYKWVPIVITPLMAIQTITTTPSVGITHTWVPIDKMSKTIQLAVICSEDQKFLAHQGFDIAAIKTVIATKGTTKKIRGASTISQQTAKNVFLWPERSWLRKGLEAYFTVCIEFWWTKERILEVYLNSIEMGNGIYGIEAATQFWFQTSAAQLTKEQATAIAAILPNPRKYIANPPSSYIQKRKKWIRIQMYNYGKLSF